MSYHRNGKSRKKKKTKAKVHPELGDYDQEDYFDDGYELNRLSGDENKKNNL